MAGAACRAIYFGVDLKSSATTQRRCSPCLGKKLDPNRILAICYIIDPFLNLFRFIAVVRFSNKQ